MNDDSKLFLETDSHHYHILYNAAASIKDVPGTICEIGTRRGGSTKYIIDGLLSVNDNNRNIVCIDPYGSIPFFNDENKILDVTDYTNDMRNDALKNLYSYVYNKPVNLVVFCIEDTEFFKRFYDGVPFYQEKKTICNQYSLVFFDGPHDSKSVKEETEFFIQRSVIGTKFVYDDVKKYSHQIIHDYLLQNNFVVVESGWKMTYVRLK